MELDTVSQDIANAILDDVDKALEVLRTLDTKSQAAILQYVAAVVIDKLVFANDDASILDNIGI